MIGGRGGRPRHPWYTLGGMNKSTRAFAVAICAAGLVLPAALTGCSSQSTASAQEPAGASAGVVAAPTGPGRVDVAQFASVITRPGIQIIDVRAPEEFASGHITGAVNIPVQAADFATQIRALDPAGQYAVYCRSGNRSQPAVEAMQAAGITNIYELESGTKGWAAEGQQLVR